MGENVIRTLYECGCVYVYMYYDVKTHRSMNIQNKNNE